MTTLTRTGGREATQGVIPGRFALSVGRPALEDPLGFNWTALTSVARLESGHTPSRSKSEYWDGEIPWVGIRDATGNHGRKIFDTAQHISQLGLDNSSARLLPADTVCLSRTASVGFVVTMGVPMATSQDFVNWVCGPELSSRYLHYLLVGEQNSVRRFAHGTTHQTMYYPEAKALHVLLPARSTQDAGAELLGALDDKIAVNEQIANRVGALAAAEFVARARTDVSNVTTFADVADVGGGGTPSTDDSTLWGGGIPWATPTDVTALHAPYLSSTSRTISDRGLAACASPLYPEGSILMTSRATIGAFAIAEQPTAVNQGFIVVNARRPGTQWWLFHQMRARVPEFLSYANGATFLELSRGRFRQLPVWSADDEVLAEFHALADGLHRRASAAVRESAQLADLRDTLLPELMSGRLRVKDAERVVEEVV